MIQLLFYFLLDNGDLIGEKETQVRIDNQSFNFKI